MSQEPVRTYIATEASPIYEDKERTRVAEGGTAAMPRKARFSGQRVSDDVAWVSPGIGFVPLSVLRECNQYQAPAVIYVRTAPRDGAPIAEGGNGQITRGSIFDAGVYDAEWLWLASELGFVRANETTLRGVSSLTFPTDTPPPPAPEYWEYVVQAGDSLSSISEQFYHSQAHAAAIFNANRDVLQDPNFVSVGTKLKIPKQP